MFLFSIFGISIGIAIALQTALNGGLRRYLRSPFLTSAVSFAVGTVFLSLICLFSGQSMHFPAEVLHISAWWLWIGGALGLIGLTSNILIFPHLGAVQTAILPILGQILMGMLIDQFGWFGVSITPFSLYRAVGIIFALSGIFLAVVWAERLRHRYSPKNIEENHRQIWLWRILGIISGTFMTTQAAINGRLGQILHSPLQAAWVSFMVGLSLLLLYVLLIERSLPRLKEAFRLHIPSYLWLGGLLGGTFVYVNALLLPRIGAGQTIVLVLLGMISGGLLVDHFALFGAARKRILPVQLLGLALLIAGVAIIRLL